MTAALIRLAPWLALLGVSWFGGCQYQQRRDLAAESKVLREERDSLKALKAKVTVQYLAAKPVYVEAVQGWDSITVTLREKEPLDPVVRAGDKVVAACNRLVSLCEQRAAIAEAETENVEEQLANEKKLGGGTLFLYGEAGGLLRQGYPLRGRAFGEAGAAIRLDRATYLQAGANTEEEIRVTLRKHVRLF